jgi:hypothetical protein
LICQPNSFKKKWYSLGRNIQQGGREAGKNAIFDFMAREPSKQIPNSKHQAPNSKQNPKLKIKITTFLPPSDHLMTTL